VSGGWPGGGQVRLTGAFVLLEPLAEEHIPDLMAIAQSDPEAYRFTSTPVTEEQRERYFAKAFGTRAHGAAIPFAVRSLATGKVVGTTRLADYEPAYRTCELGYTWFRTDLFGEGFNVDSKYILLRYAFEDLSMIRVEIHTDTRNTGSQRAIRALGARYEGVLRRHMVVKEGFVRDTMVFSITDLDWPSVREHVEARLRKRGATPAFAAAPVQAER
jgi:RimJ/RimL family protein N-acetyltransferase